MKTELYKKVFIKSEDDLPKEKGYYFVKKKAPDKRSHGFREYDVPIDIRWSNINFAQGKQDWLSNIDWYLQPIEIPTEEEVNNNACKIYANASNPDDKILAFIDCFEWLLKKLTNK